MIKVIFFDCFGVVMLTSQQSLEAKHPADAARLTELSHQADVGLLGRVELVEQVAELIGVSINEANKILSSGYHVNTQLTSYMSELKSQGYKIGLISNLGSGWFDTYVPHEVKVLFDDRVVSGDVGMVKPYPEIFELACSRLGVEPEESLFIDDIESNCEGARSAGMAAVNYENFGTFKAELVSLIKNNSDN
ncbi:HAD family phosphatase [Candidatus Saccharibacteria bacterium]|nr:HAD family phosphatase [Candidatus Saccharibacteria bacterium]